MRCAVFSEAGRMLSIEERPMPRPGDNTALIRVERCGICGSDLHMTSGGPFDLACGTVPGHEYAGEVVELGSRASGLKIGDRVTALPLSGCGHCDACRSDLPLHCPEMRMMLGGFGEYTLIDERAAVLLPDGVSFADGALVEPLASALRGVQSLGQLRGRRVAVIGAGPIGNAAIFWARRFGAASIVAIARTAQAENLVQVLGANQLLTVGHGLESRVTDVLQGAPDIVIEAAGAAGAIQQAIELVRAGGTILSLGGCIVPDTILPAVAMAKEVTLRFSVAYGLSDFRTAIDMLDEDRIGPRALIGQTINLEALPSHIEQMRQRSDLGKTMVRPARSQT